jgi:hypothetical protein
MLLRALCFVLLLISSVLPLSARYSWAAQGFTVLDAAKRAGWNTVSIIAQGMAGSDANRFPSTHAWLKEFRAAGGVPGRSTAGAPIATIGASRVGPNNPAFWRAYFEITPGDGGAMLLHAGLLLASGEIIRATYILVVARQNPAIEKEMRAALDNLLVYCQEALAKGAQQVEEAAKMHEAGSPESATGRLRELLALWPANALGHYELGLALVAQQYTQAGRKAPTRARLSIHSELAPSRAALDAYAKARIHDPLMIRAYQGAEVKGGDVFMVLGKTVRPLWEALTRASEAKVDDQDLEALANALLEAGIAEISLAVRQVLIGREGGYDDQDRKVIVATLRSLSPAAADAVGKRLASSKPEFIQIVMP